MCMQWRCGRFALIYTPLSRSLAGRSSTRAHVLLWIRAASSTPLPPAVLLCSLSLSRFYTLSGLALPLCATGMTCARRGALFSLPLSLIHVYIYTSTTRLYDFPDLHSTIRRSSFSIGGCFQGRVRGECVCVCVYICLHFRATYVHLNSHQDCCGGSTRTCRCCCCHRSATAYEITRTFKPT